MIRVREHGDTFRSRSPFDGKWTTQTVVVWEEVGPRANTQGANKSIVDSSEFLNRLFGEETGLPQIRTHSQPVLAEKVQRLCPIGKEAPGYINRELHSRPMMWNQVGRPPRNIDGRPTFFVTKLADNPESDKDLRDSNELLAKTNPELFQQMQVRVVDREIVEPDVDSRTYDEVVNLVDSGETQASKRGTGERTKSQTRKSS